RRPELAISGIPAAVPEPVAAVCRARILGAAAELLNATRLRDLSITVATGGKDFAGPSPVSPASPLPSRPVAEGELAVEERARAYTPRTPDFRFDQLVLPQATCEDLLAAVATVQVVPLVFDTWGVRQIEPYPRAALNFHGAPGTGKTMAAHAISYRL